MPPNLKMGNVAKHSALSYHQGNQNISYNRVGIGPITPFTAIAVPLRNDDIVVKLKSVYYIIYVFIFKISFISTHESEALVSKMNYVTKT